MDMAKKRTISLSPQLQLVPTPVRQSLTGLTEVEAKELKGMIKQINSNGEKKRKSWRGDDELPPAA
jgi:hypothetical protein